MQPTWKRKHKAFTLRVGLPILVILGLVFPGCDSSSGGIQGTNTGEDRSYVVKLEDDGQALDHVDVTLEANNTTFTTSADGKTQVLIPDAVARSEVVFLFRDANRNLDTKVSLADTLATVLTATLEFEVDVQRNSAQLDEVVDPIFQTPNEDGQEEADSDFASKNPEPEPSFSFTDPNSGGTSGGGAGSSSGSSGNPFPDPSPDPSLKPDPDPSGSPQPSASSSPSGGGNGFGLPQVSLQSKDSINFGFVQEDGGINSEKVRFLNSGGAPLELKPILSGTNSGAFRFSPNSLTISTEKQDSFDVACQPTTLGDLSAEFIVSTNDLETPTVSVTLTCTGIPQDPIIAVPSTLDFGNIGDTKETLELMIANKGESEKLIIEAIDLANDTGKVFSIDPGANNLPFPIAPSSSSKVGVTCGGGSDGTYTARVIILHNALDSPTEVSLKCTFSSSSDNSN